MKNGSCFPSHLQITRKERVRMLKRQIRRLSIIIALIAWIEITGGGVFFPNQSKGWRPQFPRDDEVIIRDLGVVMPLGRIVLVRKGAEYCAIKFTQAWTDKTEDDRYAICESYYQGDGTGDFLNKNAQFSKQKLVLRRLIPVIRYPAGCENLNIKCGSLKLGWYGNGSVLFYELKDHGTDADYGIELAPTKWTDIYQVNVFDPRLKWFRYYGGQWDTKLPLDQLWEDGEDQK